MGQRQAHYTTRRFREPLDDVLDRPIAFNPAFKKITGSTVAALMLSQAWYWSKRTSSEDGWFYKTIEEWEDETGLTRSEQETARKHLKRFMEVDLRGVPATLYYRLNKQEIYDALGVQFAETLQTSLPESSILVSDIPANINRNTEITAETNGVPPIVFESANKTVDAILHGALSPKAIQDAVTKHFKLTPKWEGNKFNREWMQWAMENGVTPELIERAANKWREDKAFNWRHPDLKAIQEKWLLLIEFDKPKTSEVHYL